MKSWHIDGQMTEQELNNHAHRVDTKRFPDFIREVMDELDVRYTWCYENAFNVGVLLEAKGHHCVYKEALVIRQSKPVSHAWLEVDGVDYDITGLGEIDGSFRYIVPSCVVGPNVPFNEPRYYDTYMGAVPIRAMWEKFAEMKKSGELKGYSHLCGMGLFPSINRKIIGLPEYISMPQGSLFPQYIKKVSSYMFESVTTRLPYPADFYAPDGISMAAIYVPDLEPVADWLKHAVCAENDNDVIGEGLKVAA